jgi:hypothetical protein
MRLTAATGSGAGAVGYTRIGNASVPPARITIDWRFELGGLMPDVYRLTATVTDPGWWLRSAVVNGVDILDRPLDAGSGDLTDAVVTFSDRRTTLSGAIFTGDGEPAPAYFMAVFPADRDLWHPLSRRMHLARTGTDGRWIVEGLPAGDYLLAALSDADQTDLYDPAFLASLVPNAVPISIEEGDETVQDLQIRRVPN